MADIRIEISLRRAADDQPEASPAYQAELDAFGRSLRAADVAFDQSQIALLALDAGSYPIGEFIITAIKDFGPIGVCVAAWLQGRAGRRVRLKVGEIEAEARTPAEVKELFRHALDVRLSMSEQDGA